MSKYNNFMSYDGSDRSPLVEGEELLWSGKPKKIAFLLNQILVMMPIALLWLAFDSFFIISIFNDMNNSGMSLFLIAFFAFHLMPVWIWLGNILSANRRWKNTKYYVTDRRIIIQNGFIAENYQTIYYKDIKNVDLRFSLIDRIVGVGDIYFDLGYYVNSNSNSRVLKSAFLDVENSYEVYSKLQKIVMDIQTDIEYPNALRPDENPGYNTKYSGKI